MQINMHSIATSLAPSKESRVTVELIRNLGALKERLDQIGVRL
jgi:hypothetical protein